MELVGLRPQRDGPVAGAKNLPRKVEWRLAARASSARSGVGSYSLQREGVHVHVHAVSQ